MAAAVTDATRLVIVCSPNNPTGTVVSAEEFSAFIADVPEDVLVVLDEAYAEFVTEPRAVDGVPLLARHQNLVVLRTFSKAYGLAGLRVGYALGPVAVLDAARATAIPLSVTGQASAAAIASLDAEDELLERVRHIIARRDAVYAACSSRAGTPRSRRATSSGCRRASTPPQRPSACSRPDSSCAPSPRKASGCRSERKNRWRNSYRSPKRLCALYQKGTPHGG